MKLDTYIIHTFTSTPFSGNPTGVCWLEKEIKKDILLSIANELNFPVTAFIKRNEKKENQYSIIYITPTTEIPACGHATLAAAKVVQLRTNKTSALFRTIANIDIQTNLVGDFIMMGYPVYELQELKVDKNILNSLNIDSYKLAGYCDQLETLFIELEDPAILRIIQPIYSDLVKSSDQIKEVVVTSISDNKKYDYILRSFCPWIGIDEDPVTGSVHSVLGGYWKKRLNKEKLNAFQASKRGGELLINALDDKVEIGGKSVVILEGKISL